MNGKNIAKYRKDNGLSQLEMSDLIGVTRQTLSSWENNKTSPMGEDYDRLIGVIGEEFSTDTDLTEDTTTVQAIGEVSDVVNDILYQVSNIESNQKKFETEDNRSALRHRRIRTIVVIMTCIFIIAVFLYTWFCLMNHGIKDEVIEGPDEMGTPTYFEIDDGQ